MEKMLITGASGFLGRRAARFLADCYDVLTPTHGELDFTDETAVANYIKQHRPDCILHCGAISDVGRCEKNPALAQTVNVESCVCLAQAARDIGSKCVFCSSDQVYFGSDVTTPHKEDETLSPINVYGRGKLEAEQRCLDLNPDSVFLRLSWMYDMEILSPTEHGDFLRTLLPQLNSDVTLSYPIYDRRGITDVQEVVRNLVAAFRLPGGIYNFASSNDCSTFDLMQQVFAALGLDRNRLQPNLTTFSDHPRNLCMDVQKAAQKGIFFSSTLEGLVRNIHP